MPDAYSKKLTDLVTRMLSFESEKRPTVAQILQQRFIRDRIKVFLNKQRPHSGKSSKSRKTPSPTPNPPQSTASENSDSDFDTMMPQLGTVNEIPEKVTSKKIDEKVKNEHMNRFLSDAAVTFVQEQKNKVNPETYVVQKNVSPPKSYPRVKSEVKLDNSLLSTSTARERRRQNRMKVRKSVDEGASFLELLHTTIKEPPIEDTIVKVEEKPAVLAGDQTLSRFGRLFSENFLRIYLVVFLGHLKTLHT